MVWDMVHASPEEPLSHLLLFAKAPELCQLPKPQRRPLLHAIPSK